MKSSAFLSGDRRQFSRQKLWFGLRSQHVADALRNTLSIILPPCLLFYLGYPEAAMGICTGTLLICLTDLPGNRAEKTLGAGVSLLVFAISAFFTALSLEQPVLLAVCVSTLAFAWSMMIVFGQRMATIGTMGIIVATFTIGLHPVHPFSYVLYLTLGGIWYYLVSLVQVWIFPYHPLKRALLRCRNNTAALMRLRASAYDPTVSLSGFNGKNIRLHLKLTNDHELIRRLLLGDKWAIKHRENEAMFLLHQGMVLIDLYEKVSAVHHDYGQLRELLKDSGALDLIHHTIKHLAKNIQWKAKDQLDCKVQLEKLAEMVSTDEQGQLIKKLLANLDETIALVEVLDKEPSPDKNLRIADFQSFLHIPSPSFSLIKAQLHLKSVTFRFAIRIALLMGLSIFLISFLPKGNYGYWLPLTLIVVSRPSYGMTGKRNWERFMGTVIGLVLGWLMLQADFSVTIQLSIAVAFLFVFFAFFLLRYWISVTGITIAVILCLSVYHGNADEILLNRLAFTAIGCVLGIAATFLFPIWHSSQMEELIRNAITANRDYLVQVNEPNEEDSNEVRLARKKAYLALSALNECVTISGTEPTWRRKNLTVARQVELLSFQLNALIGAYSIAKGQNIDHASETNINKTLSNLNHCINANTLAMILVPSSKPIDKSPNYKQSLDLLTVSARLRDIFSGKFR